MVTISTGIPLVLFHVSFYDSVNVGKTFLSQ